VLAHSHHLICRSIWFSFQPRISGQVDMTGFDEFFPQLIAGKKMSLSNISVFDGHH